MFDSGVGGISVWREVSRLMPGERLIYLADQARAPYGQRPLDDIRRLTAEAAGWLVERGCDVVVLACNTASAAALEHVRAAYPGTPFVGMEPAVKPAARITRAGVIGVVATAATLRAERFAGLVERFAAGLRVIEQPCPEWVELVEQDTWRDAGAAAVVDARLWPVLDAGADTVVLGCTHFPLMRPAIDASLERWARHTGRSAVVIDPSPAVAEQTKRVRMSISTTAAVATTAAGEGRAPDPNTSFFTTADPSRFAAQLRSLLHFDVTPWTNKTSVATTRS